MTAVLVRGINDVAWAVAHRLFTAGYDVVLHAESMPTTTRRGMAFTDAVFDGRSSLEGIHAVRVDHLGKMCRVVCDRGAIPVCVDAVVDVMQAIRTFAPDAIVDARMQKRQQPERQRGLTKLVIGLGPNFIAGENVDVVIETSWDNLGAVITAGAALPLAGEPRDLGGHARDRYVYAPADGVFRTRFDVGDTVKRGEVIGHIGAVSIQAPLDGVLRGITRDGVPVRTRMKIVEVDPRSRMAEVRGIAERPRRIADGVIAAMANAFSA